MKAAIRHDFAGTAADTAEAGDMSITILPNRKERESARAMQARGYLLSNVHGRTRMLVVAHRVSRVMTLPSVEDVFAFARRPQ
jgi:hypothetical protein